jgi:hypothetical protein
MGDSFTLQRVDESSETIEFGNNSALDQSMGSSMLDTSLASMISRSSRRRMKGSAVVLNTDRLQKYIRKSERDSHADASPKAEILGFKEKYLQKMGKSTESIAKESEQHRKESSKRLVEWWRRLYRRRHDRYTMDGKWTLHQVNRTFAVLLGHRVRRLMRSAVIAQVVSAQKDIQAMLSEMSAAFDRNRLVEAGKNMPDWEMLVCAIGTKGVDNLLLEHPNISHSDLTLAASMCKQLFSERQKLSDLLFGGAFIRRYPPPGYWDLTPAVHRATAAQQEKNKRTLVGASPARKLSARKSAAETPPNARMATKANSGSREKRRVQGANTQQGASLVSDSEEYFLQQLAQEGARLRHSGEIPPRATEPRPVTAAEPTRAATRLEREDQTTGTLTAVSEYCELLRQTVCKPRFYS